MSNRTVLRSRAASDSPGKWTNLLDFAALLFFLFFTAGSLFLILQNGGEDFRSFYAAGTVAAAGGNPYDYAQLVPIIERVADSSGTYAFFNPPWIALLFIPYSWLPYEVAWAAWLFTGVAIFFASIWLLRRELKWPVSGWRWWLLCTFVTYVFAANCWHKGQQGVLLLLGLVLLYAGLRRRGPWLAAAGLILLVTKPQATFLVIFVVGAWFLLRWRAAVGRGAVLAGGLLGAATVVMPRWWQIDFSTMQGLSVTLDGSSSTRVNTTLYHLLQYGLDLDGISLVVVSLVVLGLAGAALLAIGRRDRSVETLLALLVTATLLVTPYTLQYDYVVLVFPLFVALASARRMRLPQKGGVMALLGGALLIIAVQTWSYEAYWLLPLLLAVHLLVLSGPDTARSGGLEPVSDRPR